RLSRIAVRKFVVQRTDVSRHVLARSGWAVYRGDARAAEVGRGRSVRRSGTGDFYGRASVREEAAVRRGGRSERLVHAVDGRFCRDVSQGVQAGYSRFPAGAVLEPGG